MSSSRAHSHRDQRATRRCSTGAQLGRESTHLGSSLHRVRQGRPRPHRKPRGHDAEIYLTAAPAVLETVPGTRIHPGRRSPKSSRSGKIEGLLALRHRIAVRCQRPSEGTLSCVTGLRLQPALAQPHGSIVVSRRSFEVQGTSKATGPPTTPAQPRTILAALTAGLTDDPSRCFRRVRLRER